VCVYDDDDCIASFEQLGKFRWRLMATFTFGQHTKELFPFFSDDFFQIRDGKMFVYFFCASKSYTKNTLKQIPFPPFSMNKNSSCLIFPHPPNSSFFYLSGFFYIAPRVGVFDASPV
jgi:hypothetical protein